MTHLPIDNQANIKESSGLMLPESLPIAKKDLAEGFRLWLEQTRLSTEEAYALWKKFLDISSLATKTLKKDLWSQLDSDGVQVGNMSIKAQAQDRWDFSADPEIKDLEQTISECNEEIKTRKKLMIQAARMQTNGGQQLVVDGEVILPAKRLDPIQKIIVKY